MLITVVTPTYNEEQNIEKIYLEVKNVFNELDNVNYNHLFIDNDSKDNSQNILGNFGGGGKFGNSTAGKLGNSGNSGNSTIGKTGISGSLKSTLKLKFGVFGK